MGRRETQPTEAASTPEGSPTLPQTQPSPSLPQPSRHSDRLAKLKPIDKAVTATAPPKKGKTRDATAPTKDATAPIIKGKAKEAPIYSNGRPLRDTLADKARRVASQETKEVQQKKDAAARGELLREGRNTATKLREMDVTVDSPGRLLADILRSRSAGQGTPMHRGYVFSAIIDGSSPLSEAPPSALPSPVAQRQTGVPHGPSSNTHNPLVEPPSTPPAPSITRQPSPTSPEYITIPSSDPIEYPGTAIDAGEDEEDVPPLPRGLPHVPILPVIRHPSPSQPYEDGAVEIEVIPMSEYRKSRPANKTTCVVNTEDIEFDRQGRPGVRLSKVLAMAANHHSPLKDRNMKLYRLDGRKELIPLGRGDAVASTSDSFNPIAAHACLDLHALRARSPCSDDGFEDPKPMYEGITIFLEDKSRDTVRIAQMRDLVGTFRTPSPSASPTPSVPSHQQPTQPARKRRTDSSDDTPKPKKKKRGRATSDDEAEDPVVTNAKIDFLREHFNLNKRALPGKTTMLLAREARDRFIDLQEAISQWNLWHRKIPDDLGAEDAIVGKKVLIDDLAEAFGFPPSTWHDQFRRWSPTNRTQGLAGAPNIIAWLNKPDEVIPGSNPPKPQYRHLNDLKWKDFKSTVEKDRRGEYYFGNDPPPKQKPSFPSFPVASMGLGFGQPGPSRSHQRAPSMDSDRLDDVSDGGQQRHRSVQQWGHYQGDPRDAYQYQHPGQFRNDH